ncbi:hypothetical protein QTP70_019903 [Hemibagrus guttatus]|uniref:PiggyBac transposable element-derived protein domain-containing protein n=1 Tax=Hemibagrus guttatus TaxID=175788 RepID=A0AAE0Q9N4_9TELE|nr:hypothetical protein QTP70_019903 [Hemibagrus guttatus]
MKLSAFHRQNVANILAVNQWESIKQFLHFANITDQVPDGDKLFKIRPLLNFLTASFNSIQMDKMLCVDKQMIPFKGKNQLKQYVPMKSKLWGYKVFILADQNGIAL